MTTLAHLHRAIQTTLASKRLGTPVFVRYSLQGQDEAQTILSRLAKATSLVADWLGQPLERIYAIGQLDTGQVSLTLQFRSGATALVSYARCRPQGSGVDLTVLGNHGAIYHDAGAGNLWEEPSADDKPADAALRAVIEQALRSGKPEAIPEKRP